MYAKNAIIDHLNINSIRNKFDTLDNIVKALISFLFQLDNFFPINQFPIGGYKVFRCDHNRFVGGFI